MKRFVALQECSNGNEMVGNMWIEAAHFPGDTPIHTIWKWAKEQSSPHGRLIVCELQEPDEKRHPF